MGEPRQHFFESQRLRLSYWQWGDEAKPPLLLVHGGRDHARSWDRVAAEFEGDYRVVALDLRGHGDSQWAVGSQYGVPDNMLDLVRLVEILGRRTRVICHSYGGQVTLLAAGTYPAHFEALAVIEGTGSLVPREGADGMGPAWARTWSERVRAFEGTEAHVYPSVEEAAKRMLEANPRLPADFAPHLAEYATRPVDGGYVWKFDNWVHGRTSMEVRREEARRFWQAIECPVLLIYGDESRMRRDQGSDDARHFRDARSIEVPGAAHWVHHDQLDTLVRETRAFFATEHGRSEAAG